MAAKMKLKQKHKSEFLIDTSTHDTVNTSLSEKLPYLPPELWIHILPRLPVKTLLKFRCVSKSWCSIIDDPQFIHRQFKLFKNNCENNRMLAIESIGEFELNGCKLRIRRRDTLEIIDQICKTSETHVVIASCNGLLLVRRLRCSGPVKELILWNPCIRKALLIPPCPLRPVRIKYVFGYSPTRYEYMVYAFSSYDCVAGELSFAVYTVSDNLWRIGEYQMNVPWEIFGAHPVAIGGEKSVFLDGCLHWFHHDIDDNTSLVWFDFDGEKFSSLELPDAHQIKIFRCLFLLGDSLGILSISSERRCIWVLEKTGGRESWKLWFSRDSGEVGFKIFSSHALIARSRIFSVGNGGTLFACANFFYDIVTDKKLHSVHCCKDYYVFLNSHLESMVLEPNFDILAVGDSRVKL